MRMPDGQPPFVMPGLGPGIHVFGPRRKDVDGGAKPRHDGRNEPSS